MFSTQNILPESYQTLIELFEADLRFPGVDAQVLSEHVSHVAAAEVAVREAEQALEQARAVLRDKEQAALEKGERALSYLRVFAADDSELSAKVSELRLSRGVAAAKLPEAKKRGRPRKVDAEGELFSDGSDAPLEEMAMA